MLEFIVTIAIFIALVIPVGNYLYHISTGQKTFADPVMNRIDGVIYKISGVRPDKGMNWWQYAIALLTTNAVMVLIGYLILRIQSISILNPNGIASMEETLYPRPRRKNKRMRWQLLYGLGKSDNSYPASILLCRRLAFGMAGRSTEFGSKYCGGHH